MVVLELPGDVVGGFLDLGAAGGAAFQLGRREVSHVGLVVIRREEIESSSSGGQRGRSEENSGRDLHLRPPKVGVAGAAPAEGRVMEQPQSSPAFLAVF